MRPLRSHFHSIRGPQRGSSVRQHQKQHLFPVEFTNVRHQAGITLKGRSLSPLAELFIERVHAIVKPLTQSLGDKSTFDISAMARRRSQRSALQCPL